MNIYPPPRHRTCSFAACASALGRLDFAERYWCFGSEMNKTTAGISDLNKKQKKLRQLYTWQQLVSRLKRVGHFVVMFTNVQRRTCRHFQSASFTGLIKVCKHVSLYVVRLHFLKTEQCLKVNFKNFKGKVKKSTKVFKKKTKQKNMWHRIPSY